MTGTGPAGTHAAPSSHGHRTALVAVLLALAGLVLVGLAAHTTPGRYGAAPIPTRAVPSAPPSASVSPSPLASATGRPPRVNPRSITSPLLVSIVLVFVLVLIALAVLAGLFGGVWVRVASLRARLRFGARRRRAVSSGRAADDVARDVSAAVDSGLDELALGPVDEAIIECWLRLAGAAREAGAGPADSDTPQETVVRLLRLDGVRREPLEVLAELYREARFSRHTMTEQDRELARSALHYLSGDLAPLTESAGRA